MIKVFTTNKDGKIEITKEELKSLLDEAYWEGYKANDGVYVYKTPYTWSPYNITCNGASTTADTTTVTLNSTALTEGTITAENSNVMGGNGNV